MLWLHVGRKLHDNVNFISVSHTALVSRDKGKNHKQRNKPNKFVVIIPKILKKMLHIFHQADISPSS